MWVIFSGIISIIVLLFCIISSIAIGLDVRKCILEYKKVNIIGILDCLLISLPIVYGCF